MGTPPLLLWLIGTHITNALGYDTTGFFFDERYSGQALIDLMAVYERVVARRGPIRHFGSPTFAEKTHGQYEPTHFPLSSDGGKVEMILVGLEFLTT